MSKRLEINKNLVNKETIEQLLKICPFGGFEVKGDTLEFSAGCKSCGLCAKKGPKGVIKVIEEQNINQIDKSLWNGVCVYAECDGDGIHPVTFELIGKAIELAKVINHSVYVILITSPKNTEAFSNTILQYGPDEVVIYEHESLKHFNIETYARCINDFVTKYKPNTILFGGTLRGRSLAPRVAAHFKTGLTADCTFLDMKPNTDLIQVRPAFGGNVMAQIITPSSRPQMATVRYKIFKHPNITKIKGKKTIMDLSNINLDTNITIVKSEKKKQTIDISQADVIIACGRAFKTKEDLEIAENLAQELNGIVAVTRPLVEAGLKDAKYQIGLSGRSVSPKLIICLGISGAVQFTAGMNNSELIIAVNSDEHAPIFDIAHYGFVGDVYKILPQLKMLVSSLKEVA